VKKATVTKLAPKRTRSEDEDTPPAKAGKVIKGAFGRPAGKRTATKRKPIPTYKAPADFKAHSLLVQFRTEKDGLIGADIKATRYQGRFDFDADDKKKSDLASYDPQTLAGLAARLGAVTFKPNAERRMSVSPADRSNAGQTKSKVDGEVKIKKHYAVNTDGTPMYGAARLPASAVFQVHIRVGKSAAKGDILTAGVRGMWQIVTKKDTGRRIRKELPKTDVAFKMVRRAARVLPAAFAQVQMPPKRGRRAAAEGADE